MVLQIILLIIGFVILIKGADFFVDGASSLAENFKVSKMVIGLTIVAFGTSAPEFAVSVKSIISNNADMVLGNVIGSNILNILLIIGICSLIKPVVVKNNTVKKEIPFVILISTLLFFLLKDNLFKSSIENQISRNDGFIIILFFLIFIYYLASIVRNKKDNNMEESARFSLKKSLIFTLLGIVAIIIGSNIVVESASEIAILLGVSQKMIALTIVALGTSLPELVTSIVSIKKGEQEILVGNIVGSNVFNIGVVLGIPVALFGSIPAMGFNNIDLIVFLLSALILFIFAYRDHKIKKLEGIMMLSIFIIYYSFVIIG